MVTYAQDGSTNSNGAGGEEASLKARCCYAVHPIHVVVRGSVNVLTESYCVRWVCCRKSTRDALGPAGINMAITHGTPAFDAKSEQFRSIAEDLVQQGLLERWDECAMGVIQLAETNSVQHIPPNTHTLYRGRPETNNMEGICDILLDGATLHPKTLVSRIQPSSPATASPSSATATTSPPWELFGRSVQTNNTPLSNRSSARGHGWIASGRLEGRDETTCQQPLGAAACCPRFLLTCALPMTSSHSKGRGFVGALRLGGCDRPVETNNPP